MKKNVGLRLANSGEGAIGKENKGGGLRSDTNGGPPSGLSLFVWGPPGFLGFLPPSPKIDDKEGA
ncbi:hypothetical protein TIFTF001_004589 [Ficus carica]|uniref:Uncharacterized protein n=1 Tax=Ficus carica TaxID=3494 RepID=A0AA88CTF8_FICCA|nr:hypothetical protein TIFTF001_004589 [Ficus carica]